MVIRAASGPVAIAYHSEHRRGADRFRRREVSCAGASGHATRRSWSHRDIGRLHGDDNRLARPPQLRDQLIDVQMLPERLLPKGRYPVTHMSVSTNVWVADCMGWPKDFLVMAVTVKV